MPDFMLRCNKPKSDRPIRRALRVPQRNVLMVSAGVMSEGRAVPPTGTPVDPRDKARHSLGLIGFALAFSGVVFLAVSLVEGHWLIDGSGRVIARPRSRRSATTLRATTAGIIRRRSCSPPQRLR